MLDKLGLSGLIDFRTEFERKLKPNRLPLGVDPAQAGTGFSGGSEFGGSRPPFREGQQDLHVKGPNQSRGKNLVSRPAGVRATISRFFFN